MTDGEREIDRQTVRERQRDIGGFIRRVKRWAGSDAPATNHPKLLLQQPEAACVEA